jgi:phosphatidylglycerophosphatase A
VYLLIKFIVTLGVGLIPGAPGTYGSILTAAIAAAFAFGAGCRLAGMWYGLMLAGFGLAAAWAVHEALKRRILGPDPDPGCIVIDEAWGMLAAMYGFAWGDWPRLIAAILLFRLFDIVKPWPIGRLQDIHGAWGVMLDDLAAGLAAWAIIELIRAAGLF